MCNVRTELIPVVMVFAGNALKKLRAYLTIIVLEIGYQSSELMQQTAPQGTASIL